LGLDRGDFARRGSMVGLRHGCALISVAIMSLSSSSKIAGDKLIVA
jgi:hypothetical protein